MNIMKVVKIMIAATEELHQEMLEFTSLIEHLNKVLRPRGIELKRVKWNSKEEKGDFQEKLKDCEFCLKLYWTELSSNSEKELRLAYDRLKQGDNPKNLYVFFKEPANDISDALKDFKANFVTNYGHFFCKFENVDTMNLHFILQFEACQDLSDSELVTIKGGKILVDGETYASLDNIPFAALNKEYQRLKAELALTEKQMAYLKNKLIENPSDCSVLNELVSVSTQWNSMSEDFNKYQAYLFNIAKYFTSHSEQIYSERLAHAKQLFEQGEVAEADRLLNMETLKQEAIAECSLFEQNRKSLAIKIKEYQTKAQTVMANGEIPVSDRFKIACEAFQEAIKIADIIDNDEHRGLLNYSYGILLSRFNEKYQSIRHLECSVFSYRKLFTQDNERYSCLLAKSLNALAEVQFDLKNYTEVIEACKESLTVLDNSDFDSSIYVGDALMMVGKIKALRDSFREAESIFYQSLQIYYDLEAFKTNTCKVNIAKILSNIGELKLRGSRYQEALECYTESLELFNSLSEKDSDFVSNAIKVNLTVAKIHAKIGDTNSAISVYDSIMSKIEQLIKSNPFAGLPLLALAKSEKASVMETVINIEESESLLRESSKVYESLAKTNNETYLPKLAEILYSLGDILMKQKNYSEAITINQKCLYIYTKLSEWNGKKYHSSVIIIKRQMASAYSNLKQYNKAVLMLEEIVRDNFELHPLEKVGVLWELSSNQGELNIKKERIDTLNKIVELCNEKMPMYTYLKHFLKLAQNALDGLKNNHV